MVLAPGEGPAFRERVLDLGRRVGETGERRRAREIAKRFPEPSVRAFLESVAHTSAERARDDPALFDVNLVASGERDGPHLVVEDDPTLAHLVGVAGVPQDDGSDAHLRVRAGALLRADGGFLVLDAFDLLRFGDALGGLLRTLASGHVAPVAGRTVRRGVRVRPEPVPVRVRVVVIGEEEVCDELAAADPRFAHLFKGLADLDATMERGPAAAAAYSAFLARLARDETLLPFRRSAIEALLEHGARIASRTNRVTARLGRVADLAREAEHLARGARRRGTARPDVEEAVRRTRFRGSRDAEGFQRLVRDAAVLVRVHGAEVGQLNGLSVIDRGPLTYGIPTRITASVAPGTAGIVDVENAAALSGAIHVKGFRIVEGLLRSLLLRGHPLAFGASIAFEQTYGRVDGDSAAAAEVCCLLSALTGARLRQGIAVTGSVDQLGRLQAVGGVYEKIEGFYDTCRTLGLDGSQGVVIPAANVGDLMIRGDVVDACRAGRFGVYAVETIHDVLELLTGMPAGRPDERGEYPEGSLLRLAVERSDAYWERLVSAGAARGTDEPRPERVPAEDTTGGAGS